MQDQTSQPAVQPMPVILDPAMVAAAMKRLEMIETHAMDAAKHAEAGAGAAKSVYTLALILVLCQLVAVFLSIVVR